MFEPELAIASFDSTKKNYKECDAKSSKTKERVLVKLELVKYDPKNRYSKKPDKRDTQNYSTEKHPKGCKKEKAVCKLTEKVQSMFHIRVATKIAFNKAY